MNKRVTAPVSCIECWHTPALDTKKYRLLRVLLSARRPPAAHVQKPNGTAPQTHRGSLGRLACWDELGS